MRLYLYINLLALALALGFRANAQTGGDVFDQTQVITGERTLTVDKAFKITETPNTIDIPAKPGELRYELLPKRPAVSIDPTPIQPARIKLREPLDPLYHGYVKAGVGTFLTPFAEAYYTSLRHRDLAWGVHAKHLSANTGISSKKNPVAFSGMSTNGADAWVKKVFNKHSIRSTVGFNRDVWHYYGFDPLDADIEKKDYRQRFSLFTIDNKWKSYYTDSSRVNHDINLNFYHLADRYDARELGIAAFADLRAFRGDNYYTMSTGFDFISFRSDPVGAFSFMDDTLGLASAAYERDNAILHATPRIELRKAGLRFLGGIGLYGQFSNQARFHAFPDLEVSYSLFDNIFIPYAAITGSVQRNGFRTITAQNPFALSAMRLENEVVRYNVFGGIRGSVSDKMSFNVRAGLDKTDNRVLFVNDTLLSLQNRFGVVYDDISTFTIMGEFTYQQGTKWSATSRLELFSYSNEREDRAWHLPAYRFSLHAKYNLFDKLEFGAVGMLIGSRDVKSYRQPDPEAVRNDAGYYLVQLKPYFDLALTATYQYTSRLSGFIEAYNITATRYDIFYRFPAQRAFIMGGMRYAF